MTIRQTDYLGMTQDVLTLFDKKDAVWQNLTVVKEVVEGVRILHSRTENPAQKQYEGTDSLTAEKDVLFERMIDLTHKTSRKMAGYARSKKDVGLLTAIDFSRTALEAGSESDAKKRCLFVLNKAKENVSKLADYQVTQVEIDELEAAIKAYEKMPALRNTVGGESVTATTNIGAIISTLRESFEILDDFVYSMIPDADFVNTYRNLRQLKRRPVKPNGNDEEENE